MNEGDKMNGTIMQYFEWYLKPDASLWRKVSKNAKRLSKIGITALWLPPAYKGYNGINDVGYGVYDIYDLGEFDQKGSVPTKYGTKDEYIEAIKQLHKFNIHVYADISLDHMIGGDDVEEVEAVEDDPKNRKKEISSSEKILAWTKFTFPGRNNKYSDFKWNYNHFDGVDYDQRSGKTSIYRFVNKSWDNKVDNEYGNYDYLMGADIQLDNKEVVNNLDNWGLWYLKTTDIDGFRLDALKHMDYQFIMDWLTVLRGKTGKELFAVGEYWKSDIDTLLRYIDQSRGDTSLFDVPLHFNFYNASRSNGNYDMRNIIKGTIMERNPVKAVTFVENHDTQEGQSLQSSILTWFKSIAYGIILLRQEGYPCVFYGDYYGTQKFTQPPLSKVLDKLLSARKYLAYGKQNDYFDNQNIIGWTREGEESYKDSGIAVIVSDSVGGSKRMYVGNKFIGATFYDILGNIKDTVVIGQDGCADFRVEGGSISVWADTKFNLLNFVR